MNFLALQLKQNYSIPLHRKIELSNLFYFFLSVFSYFHQSDEEAFSIFTELYQDIFFAHSLQNKIDKSSSKVVLFRIRLDLPVHKSETKKINVFEIEFYRIKNIEKRENCL